MPSPVVTVAQMRAWERATWATGKTEEEVIACVGAKIAQQIKHRTAPSQRILVLAGKGHNGDDARHAAAGLAERAVEVLDISDPGPAIQAFRQALERKPDWILDGLFGIGINRELTPEWQRLVREINQSQVPVVSVDTPSGLDADTGQPHGSTVHAALTLTLAAPKIGLLRPEATEFVGRLAVIPDIGLVPCPPDTELQWTLPEDFLRFPPLRPFGGHKGTFGHLAVVAGSLGFHGAAVLAAQGALRAQPGLVTVLTSQETYLPVASQLRCPMVHPIRNRPVIPDSCSAIFFGPGLAARDLPDELAASMREVWDQSTLPVIVDASGLSWLGGNSSPPKNALRVITPHPGEAARMLQWSTQAVQQDRLAALRELSIRHGGCWVVLKGLHTLVGRVEGQVFVNSSGNPHLAQGGSGDVLGGFIAGLLAQRALAEHPLDTLRYAVWRHGAAADALTSESHSWTIDDLLQRL